MSSAKKDNSQNSDGSFGRQVAPSRNGVESSYGSGYDQRRPWAYNEYGNGSGVGSKQTGQSNGDYMNYYTSSYVMSDPYGGWVTGGNSGGGGNAGGSGLYHPYHSPMNSAYTDFYGNTAGNGPPPADHSGYYYNYFPSSNGGDYNTWGGPNFVSTAQRTSASSKHAEFYRSPAPNDYTSGGYNRESGGVSGQLERMTIYDQPSPTGGYDRGTPSAPTEQQKSFSINTGEAKKKSWATVASRPAKQSSAIGPLGLGRGSRGRRIPIGGVPGSAKFEDSPGSRGALGAVQRDSSGFWAPSSPQTQIQQPGGNEGYLTSASSPIGVNQERNSPRAVDIANSDRIAGQPKTVDYSPSSSNTDLAAYRKRPDSGPSNGGGKIDGEVRTRQVESKSNVGNAKGSSKLSVDEYNPKAFSLSMKGARFFVIKSYSEDDVHRSIKYGIWCSTEHGNKRLDAAYREREGKGPIYLFFSVNASGHFCGVAMMSSPLDYEKKSGVWAQDKWKGQFTVKWIYVKDVPNQQLRHIRIENNENKPVTNSRDTQEVPPEKGRDVLKIIHDFRHNTSLFDDFAHYERRQEEEAARKTKRGYHDDY